MSIELSRYKLHPRARFRDLGDEGIVLHQESGEAIVVNGTGAAILGAIVKGLDPVDVVGARFESVPTDDLLHEYLVELVDAKVLVFA